MAKSDSKRAPSYTALSPEHEEGALWLVMAIVPTTFVVIVIGLLFVH